MIDKKYTASEASKIKKRLERCKLDKKITVNAGKSRMVLLDEIIKSVNRNYSVFEIDNLLKKKQ